MHANLVEIEQVVEQSYVPVGGAACTDMAQDARAGAGQVFGADGCHRTGAHFSDAGRVQHRARLSGRAVEQVQQAKLGGQTLPVIIVKVADDLDAGIVTRRHVSAQYVEMPVHRWARAQVHARFDDCLSIPLRTQAGFDRIQNLIIVERKLRNIMAVQVTNRNRFQGRARCVKSAECYLKMLVLCYTGVANNKPAHPCSMKS